MTFLEKIIERKRSMVADMQHRRPQAMLEEAIAVAPVVRRRLEKKSVLQLIAEIKYKSPSRGVIREIADPKRVARAFAMAGASAISVVTDEDFFGGSLGMIEAVRAATDRPILRKDFIVDYYQLYETAAAGADMVLLIAAILGQELPTFIALAQKLGLQPLIEVHNKAECEYVNELLAPGTGAIGINNRNLHMFDVDIEICFQLIRHISPTHLRVAESGIRDVAVLKRLAEAGFDAALIGEGLVANPGLLNYFHHGYDRHT